MKEDDVRFRGKTPKLKVAVLQQITAIHYELSPSIMVQYSVWEEEDYVRFSGKNTKIQRGRPAIEYGLTLDVAKELATVDNHIKGRQARDFLLSSFPVHYPAVSGIYSLEGCTRRTFGT